MHAPVQFCTALFSPSTSVDLAQVRFLVELIFSISLFSSFLPFFFPILFSHLFFNLFSFYFFFPFSPAFLSFFLSPIFPFLFFLLILYFPLSFFPCSFVSFFSSSPFSYFSFLTFFPPFLLFSWFLPPFFLPCSFFLYLLELGKVILLVLEYRTSYNSSIVFQEGEPTRVMKQRYMLIHGSLKQEQFHIL